MSQVEYVNNDPDWVKVRGIELRSGDMCISMGCGDIESLPDEVMAARRALRGGS
jgi:UDP-N-acetylmuramate-alanine ligase